PEDARRAACQEAHQLATDVAAFGFWNASALAREVESLLEGSTQIARIDLSRLLVLVTELREELEDEATVARAAQAASTPPTARVLVISADVDFRDRLAADSRASGLEIVGAETAGAARARLAGPVDAVLLDLALPGLGPPFLASLHATRPEL